MAAAETKVVISAEDRTQAAFASAQNSIRNLATSFAGVSSVIGGAGLAAGLLATAKSAIDAGDELNKLSQKTGVAVERLSELKYAGELSDVSLESLSTALKKLSVNMNEVAGGGNNDAAAAFKAIGVAVAGAGGQLRSSDEVLADVADRFAAMEDGAGKTALAIAIFGRSGADLIPLLNQGSKGINSMATEAQQLGVVFGPEFAARSEAFNDNITRLGAAGKGFSQIIASSLLPILNEVTDNLVESAKGANEFSTSFNPLTEAFRVVMVLGANVAFVLKGVGTEIGGIAAQIAALSRGDFSAFSAIGDAMREDAQRARKEFDAYEKRLMDAGTAAATPARTVVEAAGKAKAQVFSTEKKTGSGTDPYAQVTKQLAEKNAQLALEAQGTERLTAAQQFALKVMTDIQGGYLKLTTAQKQSVTAGLEQLLANDQANQATEERIRMLKEAGKAAEDYQNEEERARLMVEDVIGGNRQRIERTGEQERLIGLRERERQVLEAVRALEDEATAARQRAFRDIKDPALYLQTVEAINTALAVQKAQLAEAAGAAYDYATSWEAGVSSALASYLDEVGNMAAKSEQLVTKAFKGMEDSLVEFVKTGKLDFRGLADSIISDIIRIQVQQQITKPLAGMAAGASDSIGGWLKGLFGGGRAAGGPVQSGQFYVVGEQGPEILVPGTAGTVIPNGALAGGGGQTVVVNQTINVDSRSDRSVIIAAMVQAKEAAKAEILDSMRRGGTFARA